MLAPRSYTHPSSFLDISEYIIKEHSPSFRPEDPTSYVPQEFRILDLAVEIDPVDHDPTNFKMTPLCQGLAEGRCPEFLDINDCFTLEPLQETQSRRRRKEQREFSLTYLLHFENPLDCIVEEKLNEEERSLSDSDFDHSEMILLPASPPRAHVSVHLAPVCTGKSVSVVAKETEEEKQSTIDLSLAEFSENIERFSRNPKHQLIRAIRQIERNTELGCEWDRREEIKKFIEKYLFEHEYYCYEQSWRELNQDLNGTVNTIIEGLEETFAKIIGALPFEIRRVKLLKYLEKKYKRIWRKKVSYNSRKKVADGRLRIKGKFVTREQACEQLGLTNLQNYNAEEIKEMLERKIDEGYL